MNFDLLSLKLHVDDSGIVWYGYSDQPTVCTNTPVAGFLMNGMCEIPNVRLIGCQNNLQLILALYERRMRHDAGVIEVCSPLVCNTRKDRSNPETAILAMRSLGRSASTGGWHVFDKKDYFSYALAMQLIKVSKVDQHALELLENHVAWPALTFIPHLNKQNVAVLLAVILDPRWYVDPMYPTRGSKLRSFLGLDQKTYTNLQHEIQTDKTDRLSLVVSAWKSKLFDLKHIDAPGNFLQRTYYELFEKKGPVTAILRTSQVFIDFLRLTWLRALSMDHHVTEDLFVPEYFFKTKNASEAYKSHMKS